MLHYDTPALSHLYFVDPQWLCDMLAHIVTVPEVNRFIQRTEGRYTCAQICTLMLRYIFLLFWLKRHFSCTKFCDLYAEMV